LAAEKLRTASFSESNVSNTVRSFVIESRSRCAVRLTARAAPAVTVYTFSQPPSPALSMWDVREIQNDLLMALIDEAVDLVLEEFVALPQGDLPFQVEHHHVADSPFLDLHGNSR
jgi:hypothetical protein